MDYFELAQASSIRMCLALEKRFPDFRRKQLELMRLFCLCAYNSEIYDGVCPDSWLRTTITLKSHDPHIFSPSDESPELPELPELLELREANIVELSQASWEYLKEYNSSLTEIIEFRSNILPRRAYWERLRELQHSSYWTRVLLQQLSMLDYWRIIPCLINRRGFFPITIINQALEEGGSLKEKVTEWRQTGGTSCDLATHFRRPAVPDWHRRSKLREINRDDVEFSMENDILGQGSTGTVYKVAWRNGTYAMKSYRYNDESLKERDIASRILHPHIVHGFGYGEVNGQCCLLMEVLRTTLTDYALEKARARNTSLLARVLSRLRGVSVEPVFSREDTFDVLLQIASALEHSHLNDVVNGDVKPNNILLDHFEMLGKGRYFLAKVTDFGDAQEIIQGVDFRPAGPGTTQYAAPELLEFRVPPHEKEFADPKKMDVYGFGGIAYEVLTGYPVYHERNSFKEEFLEGVIKGDLKPCGSELWRNSGLKERFPAGLIDLVEKCWELLPENRPSFTDICAKLVECKSTAPSRQWNRAANLWKFTAAVLLVAFICFLPLLSKRIVAYCIDFIVLILFFFSAKSVFREQGVGIILLSVVGIYLLPWCRNLLVSR